MSSCGKLQNGGAIRNAEVRKVGRFTKYSPSNLLSNLHIFRFFATKRHLKSMRQKWHNFATVSKTEAHTTTVSARLRSAGFLHTTLGLREEWGYGFRYRIGLTVSPTPLARTIRL
jgi:hypothetical protein